MAVGSLSLEQEAPGERLHAPGRMTRHLTKLSLIALLASCGSSLRTVPRGPPAANIPWIVVDYPPPPSEVEDIPADPGKPCAWQDGYWNWVGRRWQWTSGKWVIAPKGCHYVDPWMSWISTHNGNELHYWLPRWLPDVKSTICREPVTCRTARKTAR